MTAKYTYRTVTLKLVSLAVKITFLVLLLGATYDVHRTLIELLVLIELFARFYR